jgi:MscS family membrane protein
MTTRVLALALLAWLVGSSPVPAQETTGPATTATTLPALPAPEDADLGFTSPRSTMRGYLLAARAGDYAKAAEHLDLRRLPKSHRAATGPLFARQLKTVLDRTLWVELEALSDTPEGDRDDGLPARNELVGTIRTATGRVNVMVDRVPAGNGTLAWKISGDTVADIAELYAEFGDGPLADVLPAPLIEIDVFGLHLWQWIGLLLLVGAAALVGWLTTGTALRAIGLFLPAERDVTGPRLLGALTGPLRLLIALAVVAAGIPWLALTVPAQRATVLTRTTLTILAVTWLWLRVVDVVAAVVADRLYLHGRASAVSMIPLGRRSLRVFVAVIAGIAILQNLGFNATGILAGLGVGGLALALAAQKTVENLFGGMMLVADQPVRVGDTCRFGTRIGTVEDIGLRSTRLRTTERSIISVPNAEFASMQLENLATRDRLWLQTTLALRLDTSGAQVRQVLEGIREILQQTAKLEPTSAAARLVGFSAGSLDLEVSGYVLTRDWNEFLAIREDVYLRILDLLADEGAGFAGRPGMPPSAS